MKIIAIKNAGALRAATFLTWQRDFDRPQPLEFDPILEQVRLTTVEHLTGLSFGALHDADPLRFGATLEEVDGTRRVRANSARSRSAAITCAGDIML